ncbi:MAG: VWA domain-containing protein [Pseudomonadota bacterium]|nr:VWA domain-containing protein [Pseudomonadota bacterium]
MDRTITRFVHALRNADVEVSPAETLDALAVVDAIGVDKKAALKFALAMALAKSPSEKYRFSECFDLFFGPVAFQDAPKASILRSIDSDHLIEVLASQSTTLAETAQWVLQNNATELGARLRTVALAQGLYDIEHLRDKTKLQRQIADEFDIARLTSLQGQFTGEQAGLRTGIAYIRQYLNQEIKQFVDLQYDLVASVPAKKMILSRALEGAINQIPKDYELQLTQAVADFAEKLKQKYRKRRRQSGRGALDIRRMLRRNVAFDGTLIELAFKQKRKDEGTLYLICDVSGSVAPIARFLLFITHRLHECMPKVRSFAFSNQLGEISEYFDEADPHLAIERALYDWGNGSTDYGRAFLDFRKLVHQELNSRSTLLILGDARSNFYPAAVGPFKECTSRVKRTIWLNPETRDDWGQGDSDMPLYAPFCSKIQRLSSLQDLKALTEELINLND